MLSAALKLGSTRYMEPHPDQQPDGWISDPRSRRDEDQNLARMILRAMKNTKEAASAVLPTFGETRFGFKTRRFEDGDGKQWTAKDFNELSRKYHDLLKNSPSGDRGIGRTTLARAVFTASLAEGAP